MHSLHPDHAQRTLAALGLLLAAACGAETQRPADVILISLDSVRADDLTFRDPDRSPVLAHLARGGTVFDAAVAGSSWTLPTHVEMFTGQPPALHGVHADDVRIDPHTQTLGEVFSDAGYTALGFWSGWYLAGEYGFARGFQRYEGVLEGAPPADGPGSVREERKSHREVTSKRLVERVRSALAELEPDEPLLLFVHFFDPHYDYVPPAPWETRFDPDYTGDLDGRDFWTNRRIYDEDATPPRRVSERDLQHLRSLYRGEIAWTDAALGELFELLRARGRLDGAALIVTSDHGEEFFEHGGRGHRQSLYDEVLRVPLLVRPPRARGEPLPAAPRVCDVAASHSDLLPTLAQLAGVEVPESVVGASLVPWLEGADAPSARPPVYSTLLTKSGPSSVLLETLREPQRKLLRRVRVAPDGTRSLEAFHVYDLGLDPHEQRPRVGRGRDDMRVAWADFEAASARLRAAWARLSPSPAAERTTTVRSTFAGELEGLGYLGDDAEGSGPPEWTLTPPAPLGLPDQRGTAGAPD